MHSKWTFILTIFTLLLFLEFYVFQAVRVLTRNLPTRWIDNLYIIISVIVISVFLFYNLGGKFLLGKNTMMFVLSFLTINFFSKFIAAVFLLVDDIIRLFKWIFLKLQTLWVSDGLMNVTQNTGGITRTEFLVTTGMAIAAIPALSMTYGIINGVHDYRVLKHKLKIKGLPSAFHGLRIGQVSDIHCGSFYNKNAVVRGVDLLMREKTDLIFFTGDLVNTETNEMKEYMDIFDKIKAPLGVFSILGNHDYGDYKQWDSVLEKQKNLDDIIEVHRNLGWTLLRNENRKLKINNESIAIAGVDNWGAMRWSQKYGNLTKTLVGLEDIPVKLLLSHDPSHWDAEILQHKDIQATFSGHTHGFQFGIEIGNFKWSPGQYFYKQWAGLYEKNEQYLYVNRGFGFVGYPGRVGINPELTVFELEKG